MESERRLTSKIMNVDPPGEPGLPILTTVKNRRLRFFWSPPKTNGGSPVTDYVIETKNELPSAQWVKIATVKGNRFSACINFYVKGTYQFRVYARNNGWSGKPSKPSAPLHLDFQNEPPKINWESLKTVVVCVGQSFSLCVNVSGEPPPIIFWSLNDKPIQPSEYICITNTSYSSMFVCYNAQISQSGIYEIEAVNDFGSEVAHVEVTVIDPMLRILYSRAVGRSSSFEISDEYPMEEHLYRYTSTSTRTGPPGQSGPPTVLFKDNYKLKLSWTPPEDKVGGLVDGYIIEAKGAQTWTKIATIRGNVCFAEIYFYIHGLHTFRVCAFNKDCKGRPSEASELIHLNIEKECPKIDLGDLDAVVIDPGDSFVLWAKIQGEPPAQAQWSLNRRPIGEIQNLTLTDTLYDTGIACKSAYPIHSGSYVIVANNECGSDTAVVDVTVLKHFPMQEILKSPDNGPILLPSTTLFGYEPENFGFASSSRESSDPESSDQENSDHEMCKNKVSTPAYTNEVFEKVVYCPKPLERTYKNKTFDTKVSSPEVSVKVCQSEAFENEVSASESSVIACQNEAFKNELFCANPSVFNSLKSTDFFICAHFALEAPESDDNSIISHYLVERRRKNFHPEKKWEKLGQIQGIPFITDENEYEFRLIAVKKGLLEESNVITEGVENEPCTGRPSKTTDSLVILELNENKGNENITPDNDYLPENQEVQTQHESLHDMQPNETCEAEIANATRKESCSFETKPMEMGQMELETAASTISAESLDNNICEAEIVNATPDDSCDLNNKLIDEEKELKTAASAISNEISGPPPEPTGPFLVSDINKNGCKLKWNQSQTYDGLHLEGYLIEILESESCLWFPETLAYDTEIKITGLSPGNYYNFRVKAVNQSGESHPLYLETTVIAKDPSDSCDEDRQENNNDDISTAFKNLWFEKLYPDVEFSLQNEDGWASFSAHKLILSLRSPVFADKFFKQGLKSEVILTITDVAPSVFEVMLKFMYGISTDLHRKVKDLAFIIKVYKAATLYEVEALKNICCKIFLSSVPNKNNVFQLLDAGKLVDSDVVQNRCLKVLQTQTSEALAAQQPSSITISMVLFILNMPCVSFSSEYELILWVLSWADSEHVQTANQGNFKALVKLVVPHLQLTSLTADEFATLCEKYEDLMNEEDGFRIIMNILIPGSRPLPRWYPTSQQFRIHNKKR